MPRTFASLFTGGGLADIGAMQAGFELAWGIELDPEISAVANQNLKHRDSVHTVSVIGFDWSSVERVDHLHMSPPCQDFSVAKTTGKKANPNDEIADACIEAIKTLQPSSVTLENVEGYRKAKGFQRIVDHLWGAGYWVNVDVLNAADFGAPQTRRRLILRAVHGGFPSPLPPKEPWKGWYEAIADLIDDLPETQFAEWQLKRLPDELKETCYVEQMNSIRPATTRNIEAPATSVTASQLRRPISSPKAFIVDGKTNGNGDRVTEIAQDDPMFCVNASASKQVIRAHVEQQDALHLQDLKGLTEGEISQVVGDWAEPNRLHAYLEVSFTADTTSLGRMKASAKGRVVRMTPRALARFQTVPDWYQLPEKTSLACKIIGNGVPCLMMQKILS